MQGKGSHRRPVFPIRYKDCSIAIYAHSYPVEQHFTGHYRIRLDCSRRLAIRGAVGGGFSTPEQAEDQALWSAIRRIDGWDAAARSIQPSQ